MKLCCWSDEALNCDTQITHYNGAFSLSSVRLGWPDTRSSSGESPIQEEVRARNSACPHFFASFMFFFLPSFPTTIVIVLSRPSALHRPHSVTVLSHAAHFSCDRLCFESGPVLIVINLFQPTTTHPDFVCVCATRNSQYYEKVSDPLDLSTIEKQILTGHYKTVEAFDTDMLKVFRNAEVGKCTSRGEKERKELRRALLCFPLGSLFELLHYLNERQSPSHSLQLLCHYFCLSLAINQKPLAELLQQVFLVPLRKRSQFSSRSLNLFSGPKGLLAQQTDASVELFSAVLVPLAAHSYVCELN